jgi:hypothetical protein
MMSTEKALLVEFEIKSLLIRGALLQGHCAVGKITRFMASGSSENQIKNQLVCLIYFLDQNISLLSGDFSAKADPLLEDVNTQ